MPCKFALRNLSRLSIHCIHVSIRDIVFGVFVRLNSRIYFFGISVRHCVEGIEYKGTCHGPLFKIRTTQLFNIHLKQLHLNSFTFYLDSVVAQLT